MNLTKYQLIQLIQTIVILAYSWLVARYQFTNQCNLIKLFFADQISHLINPSYFISGTVVTSAVCCGGGGSSQQMWQSGFRICNLKGNFITCSVILFTSCLIQIQCFHCLHTDASECNFIGFPSSSCNLKISS